MNPGNYGQWCVCGHLISRHVFAAGCRFCDCSDPDAPVVEMSVRDYERWMAIGAPEDVRREDVR